LIRERTPIVDWDHSDISDDLAESEDDGEDDSDESDADEVVAEGKKYYWLAIRAYLESELGDCKYFLNGKRTNHTESFHNVCNLYCPKGSNISMKIYVMKKQMAGLHWTYNKYSQQLDEELMDVDWKVKLLALYLNRKKDSSTQMATMATSKSAKKSGPNNTNNNSTT
jgi:hypothetical protein